MNTALRTTLLFLGLVAFVVAGSFYYSHTMRSTPQGPSPDRSAETAAPWTPPANLSPELQTAIAAVREQRFEEARPLLERIPPEDPGYLVALRHLGVVTWNLKDYHAALATFNRLIDFDPENAELRVSKGLAQYRLLRPREAELSTLRALEIEPDNLTARYNVALFRLAQGRLGESIDAYERAMRRDTELTSVPRVLAELSDLQRRRPEIADTHYVLAYFAHRLSQPATEVSELESYLALEPVGPAVDIARERLVKAREAVARAQ